MKENNDSLKQFLELRETLLAEKVDLETRLAEINTALGLAYGYQGSPRGRAAGQGNNGISLKLAVMRLTNGRALTKSQILTELEVVGYKFRTSRPVNSLGVILYGRTPKFNREHGAFILAPGQLLPTDTVIQQMGGPAAPYPVIPPAAETTPPSAP
ncbi:MAG: hypothetical protein NTV12_04230 [Verrucomicrobia bacterium]|nr:hypothetical protein [Verrucomicrobiota bacterium]